MNPDEAKAARAAAQRRAWRESQEQQAEQTREVARFRRQGLRRERRFWIWIGLGSGLVAAPVGWLMGSSYYLPFPGFVLPVVLFLAWLGYCSARIVRTVEAQTPTEAVVRGFLVCLGLLVLNVVIVSVLLFGGCFLILKLGEMRI